MKMINVSESALESIKRMAEDVQKERIAGKVVDWFL